jgi:hypothetical protein
VNQFSIPSARRLLASLALLAVTVLPVHGLMQDSPQPFYLASASLPDAPLPQSPNQTPSQPTQSSTSAQQTTPPESSAAPQDEKARKKQQEADAQRELNEQTKQHLLGVVPVFNSVYSGQALPLNAKQKFELAFKSATNPFNIGLAAAVAGIGQAQNSFPEYGQGAEGYFKRFGAGYADSFNGTMLGNAAFPVLLKQDPRYYRLGAGSFQKRFFYSLLSAARCKSDRGKWQPNYSNLLGNIAAGGISNFYYPEDDRGFGLTIQRGLIVTAEGALGGLLLEFAPDIEHLLGRKKTSQAALPQTTQPAQPPADHPSTDQPK